MSGQTPSQTAGPFFGHGLAARQYGYDHTQIADGALVGPGDAARIRVTGILYDGEGVPIRDALVEIWQADGQGRYGADGFRGFGRVGTGTSDDGAFAFETIKPGRNGGAAPFLSVIVSMRGLLSHVYTRAYFDDEAAANAEDAVLSDVAILRRRTLMARRVDGAAPPTYRFDIRMQGDDETVFFDV